MSSPAPEHTVRAALIALLVLQASMLAALYSGTPPHPPLRVAPFALGPFLGAALAVTAAALTCGTPRRGAGALLAVIAGLSALVSYGPQKWIDPAFPEIWPAVLVGEVAVAALFVGLWRGRRDATVRPA